MFAYTRMSAIGIIAIVLLRVGIGWHFYMEGVSKVQKRDFNAEGFLNAAEGPLADRFHDLIWDYDGYVRLDRPKLKKLFDDAAEGAKKHFGLTEQQVAGLNKVRDNFQDKLDEAFSDTNKEDVDKYWINVKRVKEKEQQPIFQEVSSLNGQVRKIEKESRAAVLDTMKTVDAIWSQYERRLNGVANQKQFAAVGPYRFRKPGSSWMDTDLVNQVIPIFDMAIGILLMIGLLTPLAATLAGLFLLSVVLSQMPGYPGTAPTYFQAVECLALFALAGLDAGRFAGLDFIPWAFWRNRRAKAELAA